MRIPLTKSLTLVFAFRSLQWFFLKHWYAMRWGEIGALKGDTLYLIDCGGITFGYVTQTFYKNSFKFFKIPEKTP